MPARDALHYQMVFMDALAPGGILGGFLDGFERSQRGMVMASGRPSPIDAVPNPIGMFAPSVPYDESGDGLRQYFARHMEMALAFYVDPRMTALVTAAAESMPTDAPLRPSDLPTTHGFLLLPTGLGQIDLRGQLMIHNVVVWFQRGAGVDLWFLSNKYDGRDMVNLRQRRMVGDEGYARIPELSPAVYTRIEFGQGVPISISAAKVLPPEITESMVVTTNPKTGEVAAIWGEGYDLSEWLSAEEMRVAPSAPVAWILAMWRLMQQTITDVRTEEVDRPLRKAARKRRMRQYGVTVIALRKRKRVEGGEPQKVDWSHRWLRRGHWRQQWVGPRDGGPEEHYQIPIYIHPKIMLAYRDDLPLLMKDRVYSLER